MAAVAPEPHLRARAHPRASAFTLEVGEEGGDKGPQAEAGKAHGSEGC